MKKSTATSRKYLDELMLKEKIRRIADQNAAAKVGDTLMPVCPNCGGTRFTGRYSGVCEVGFTFDGGDSRPFSWETYDEDDETLDALYCYECGIDYEDDEDAFHELLPGTPGVEPIG